MSPTDSLSTWGPKVRACVKNVLDAYGTPEKRQLYEVLVARTRAECEKLLESIEIKGVVQGRVKKYDSLKKKMEDPSNFATWISEGKDIYEHPDMGDLAAVRIGLYFPDDLLPVEREILKRF